MDIKKFVKLNEKGELEFDESGFQSGLDAEISRAVDKYANGKGKDEIRKQLEAEAKLTAEEKLKADKQAFEDYKKAETIKLVQAKAQARLDGKGFTESEIKFILSSIGENEESDLATIDTLIKDRTDFIATTQQNAIQNLQQQQTERTTPSPLPSPDIQEPSKQTTRTKSDILSFYRPQQN